ncbi:MAG: polyribonucleotide nucleotidyltransferase [Bacteroidales bacterium]|nr:polyribonucleotide nucleotidyltransferase [Bacteroidales bacterium]
MNIITKEIDLGDGRIVSVETGKLAKQADGSVIVRQGNTVLLATVCSAKESNPEADFMPLTVEYQEKYYSNGRFPGGFLKREGKASDAEILTARLVDRALRPLFPKDYHSETFVNVYLLSADKETMPDAYAGFAASCALSVSDVPILEPIAEVRVARVDGKIVINPTYEQCEKADIEMVVGATYENILMVEGEMNEVSEAEMLEAIKAAHDAIKPLCKLQEEMAKEKGVVKRTYEPEISDPELQKRIHDELYQKIYDTAKQGLGKQERQEAFDKIEEDFTESLGLTEEELEEKQLLIGRYYHDELRTAVRRLILDEGKRLDSRKTDEIRPIWCEADVLPSVHGSAIFTRGETQSLATCTLGTKLDEQIIDGVLVQGRNNFLLHYNFPPFATGEAKAVRGVSRREVGHGNLAHRALKKVLPSIEENPYTIRVVSDILESNGSSSMASVCGGCMALMDAGVKIKRPVSGIAMGLITDTESDKYAVLSDILGDEDHLGDMDFKVAGTTVGITACQMDIKVDGLSYEILAKALQQAKEGRAHILNIMLQTIPEPREDYKPFVPRMVKFTIAKDYIGAVIGPGGKIIQEIQADTNSIITIDEEDGVGIVAISAVNKADMDAAMARIKAIVAEPEVGEVYHGTVKSIVEFGAFIEILPGKEGLLHVSEIDWKRVENVSDVLNEGDEIDVKLIDIDKKNNKLKLSRRALLPKPEGYVERPARPERSNDRGPRSNDRGGFRGDRGGFNDRGNNGGFNDRRGNGNNGGFRGNRRGSDDAQG